jgi:hypothetical protein
MKEVKLVRFTDLTSSEYWSRDYSDEVKISQYENLARKKLERKGHWWNKG